MDEVTEPDLSLTEKKVVLITHDESTFYANDGLFVVWMENKKTKIRPKTVGSSIMVSGFTCECHGFCADKDTNLRSYKLFEAGKNREGWFTNDDLVAQCQQCFPLFEKIHPNCDLVFGFDNSMSHHKRAPDGLDASLMILADNGKNVPMMKGTKYIDVDGNERAYSMQNHLGQPKGIKTVLCERGKWRPGMLLDCVWCKMHVSHAERPSKYEGMYSEDHPMYTNQCCARHCLSQQPDFLAQREWLREVVEDRGHFIVFYPKYHCELNYIEMVWALVKRHLRSNCTYKFADLKAKIPNVLENVVTPAFCRRASRKCFRTMQAYRQGLEGPLLDYAIKKYSSHRRIPDAMMEETKQEYLNIVSGGKKVKKQKVKQID